MATEKTLKTRVKMKHGKESEWALATKFTPLIGEIIVYDVDNNHTSPRFKVGDGLTNVNNLKFVNQDELAKITTLGDELLAVKNGYLPLTGGTLTGTLTATALYASDGDVTGVHFVTKTNNYPEVYFKNAAGTTLADFYVDTTSGGFADVRLKVFSDSSSAAYYTFSNFGRFSSSRDIQTITFRAKSDSNPGLVFLNNSETMLSQLYVATTDGSYGNVLLKVLSSATKASYFTFKNDGIFSAPSDIISNGGILKSSRNTNPCFAMTNQNGAWLASLVAVTSDGSYGNAQLTVYKSATESSTFTFSNQGSFRAPNTVYSSLFAVQSNSFPQLTLQNNKAANLATLYVNTPTGDYSNVILRVYSSTSEYSSFSFGSNGVLEFGGVLRSGNHTIKGNFFPALSFTDLSVNKTYAYLQPQTSAGDYADVLLAVKNNSGQSNFLFSMNGDLTIGKKLYNPGGQVVKRLGLTSGGTNGYVKFATIDLTGTTYQNQPIRIAIAQRGRYGSFKLRFASVNSADPAVEQFVKTGQIEVYIHKSATSTWDLYLKKSEAYDDIDVTVYENGSHNSFKFTWVDTLVSTLPTGYTSASPEAWTGAILSADKGGTGCSSLRAAGSAIINALDTGTAQPLDGDYYICQTAGGGTTDTEYVRRPMSALWSYIKSKENSTYLPLTGGTLTGHLNLSGSVVITLNSKSDERQFMIRNSTNTENIYLYQTASARGIYSTCSTGSVAVLQALAGSNSWTFNGVATSANTLNNTLSIEKGGTGATTAADARTNLEITPANIGAAASSHTHSYLPLSGGTISGSIAVTGNVTSNGKSVYTAGGNVIYSSTQPTGSTGMIWLKPV